MAPQGSRPWEGFTTVTAGVWLDAGVTPHMSLSVLVASPTDVADLPSVSVNQKVFLRVSDCGKLLPQMPQTDSGK